MKIFLKSIMLLFLLCYSLNAFAYGDNYLKISKIENALFNRNFEYENIYSRLNRIETKLFKTTNQTSSLSDRFDAIINSIDSSLMSNIPLDRLEIAEQKVFNRKYTSYTPENRICRLEERIFGTIQNGSLENRFKRIENAIVSSSTTTNSWSQNYNYRNNRAKDIMQNVLGGIGTITGLTPPVYDPLIDSFDYVPSNYSYRKQYRTNTGAYDTYNDYGSSSSVKILY